MSIHVNEIYKNRLTDYPYYDWEHSPVEGPMIPIPDLKAEATQGEALVADEQKMSAEGLAQAVPAVAEMRRAA